MANKTTLADTLAQELGYKDAKALKDQIKRSGGGEFSSNVKGRLESGAGFGESFRESTKDKVADIQETFSKKGLKKFGKRTYNEFFGGDDIFSSYMRGRLNKGKRKQESTSTEGGGTSPTKEGSEGVGAEELAVLNVIAKNCMSLPGIARDMNVLRQNLVKLVKLQPGGKDKARVGADMYFKTADQREDMLESQKAKAMSKVPTVAGAKPPEEKKEGGGFLSGILNSVMSFFSGGFMTAIKSLFSPGMILKAITKVFVPLTIIASLVNGIMDGWKKWQETGDLSEALITGLGGVIDFLTFGLFGTEELKKAFDWIGGFVGPIVDSISETFDSLKMWVVNNIGIPEITIPLGKISGIASLNTVLPSGTQIPETISFGPYYPFKKNPKSTEPQKSERPSAKESETKAEQTKTAEEARKNFASTDPRRVDGQSSEQSSTNTTPTAIKKKDGQELKLPQGVTYNGNDGMFNYKGVGFTAERQDELDRQTKAIDSKTIVEYQGVGPSGPATITFDGTTGQKTFSAPKPEQPQLTASSTTPPAAGVASAGGGGGGGGGGGSSGGATASPTQTAPSGATLSADSSSVAEGQRLDSAADAGVTVNAPVTNNSSETTGKDAPSLIADAYNRDFVESYSFVG
jgi:hypothetical protein